MRSIVPLPSFDRCVKKLGPQAQKRLKVALEKFNEFIVSGNPFKGLGFKKINHDKFEFRVDIHLRVVIKVDRDICYLVLVGNHDDIRKYLRQYRQS
jgi:mRNA-degrading endonuclease RelE of RelBE toxin-antitoxin system